MNCRAGGRGDWARLETAGLTWLYWVSVAGFALAYWLTPLPPCIDYPQHLALGAVMRRMLDSASPERGLFEISWLTYNGLFHFLVAGLSLLVPPEVAGKLLLSAIVVLDGIAFLAGLRLSGRPRWYAFLLLPFCYGYIAGWGFVNYMLATPLGLLVWVWWMRWREGERGLWWRVVVGSLLVASAHVLSTLCLCLSVCGTLLSSRTPAEHGAVRWLRAALRDSWPLLFACVYSVVVFLSHRLAPHIYWEPEKDGIDIAAHQKLLYLSTFAVDNLDSPLDDALFLTGAALLALLWLAPWLGPGSDRAPREFRVLAVGWGLLYLIVPRVLMSTWYIFERIPLVWFAYLAWGAPAPRWAPGLQSLAVMVGLGAALNTAQAFARIPDARDASAIIDDIPSGGKAVAVIYGQGASPVIWRQIWVHLLAYHVVRHPGQIAFDFTRYASLPVRRRDAVLPPVFPSGLEWHPELYEPTSRYARLYPLVLVRTPDQAPEEEPRVLVFGEHAEQVRLLSRRGRFWLYDSSSVVR